MLQPRPEYLDTQHYRPPKVDLPRLNGEDVMGWLTLVERYMRVHHVPPLDWVQTAVLHFGNDASVWMSSYKLRHPLATWDEFASAFLSRFGGGTAVNFKGALSHLQQTSSVDDFILSFTKLSCRAPNWLDCELLHMFISRVTHFQGKLCQNFGRISLEVGPAGFIPDFKGKSGVGNMPPRRAPMQNPPSEEDENVPSDWTTAMEQFFQRFSTSMVPEINYDRAYKMVLERLAMLLSFLMLRIG
ncbi:hypothetical protein ACLB2K_043788 [Fragaria x ananassa]